MCVYTLMRPIAARGGRSVGRSVVRVVRYRTNVVLATVGLAQARPNKYIEVGSVRITRLVHSRSPIMGGQYRQRLYRIKLRLADGLDIRYTLKFSLY